jgi:hypothetical protein
MSNPGIAFSAAWVVTLCALGSDPSRNAEPPPAAPPPAPARPADEKPKDEKKPDTGTGPSDDKKDDKKRNDPATATSEPQPRKLVVVVSKENPSDSLREDELRRIFLREVAHWKDNENISVFERPADSPIGLQFSQWVLKKTAEELKDYWIKLQITRGMKPPKVLRSASMVKEYLQRVRGGIGYLYEDEVDEYVKVLVITDRKDEDGS